MAVPPGWGRDRRFVAPFAFAAFVLIAAIVFGSGAESEASQLPEQQEYWVPVGGAIEGEGREDRSGNAVALSADGSRVVIGAAGNSAAGTSAGHVRVFDLAAGAWVQVGGDIDGAKALDQAGASVAISADGSRVAVGAIANDDAGRFAGQVRVFDLIGTAWVQVGGDINGEAPDDVSGRSISLSADGSRIAVGADLNDGGGNLSGHVRVFDLVAAEWVQVGNDIDGTAARDFLGSAVSLSVDGSRIAVVAPGRGDLSSGYVRVFDLVGGVWVQAGGDLAGETMGHGVGRSVSMSADGSRVAISAGGARQVELFDFIGGVWVLVGSPIEDSGLHISLAADGDRIATASSLGVRVFDLVGGAWTRTGAMVPAAPVGDFGESLWLSADGERGAVGAHGIGESGQVWVFELGFSTATCQGKPVTSDMQLGGSGIGTPGDDVISGSWRSDVIDGGDGDDTICGLEGWDQINGGEGADVIVGGDGWDAIDGDAGDDQITGDEGDDSLDGGDGDDLISGNDGDDLILGRDGNDELYGGSGVDRIAGQNGDDRLYGEGGSDHLLGGDGADVVMAGSGADAVWGGSGDDVLFGMGGQDRMWGGDGNDQMQGNWQSDRMWGGRGNDRVAGAHGKDKIYGEGGDDELFGGNNTDYLDGGDGNDTANGQRGKDNPLVPDVSGCIAETRISC